MQITKEEAIELFNWIKWHYISYENENLHKFIDRLSIFVKKQENGLESRTNPIRKET